MNEQLETGLILSADGRKFYYRMCMSHEPKAVVCILHGHGEHSGRYLKLMNYLDNKQIASLAIDFRGHGLTKGNRGHIPSMDMVLNDIEEALKLIRVNFLDLPIFLFGHSFGGCVALNFVLKRPIFELSGFIASAPWLALAFEPPKWKVSVGKLFAKILPKLALPSGLKADQLTKISEEIKMYEEDPLVHDRVSTRFYDEVSNAGQFVLKNIDALKLKGMIYHGSADAVIDFETNQSLAKNNDLLSFHEVTNSMHEPHNDEERAEVFELIFKWIDGC